MLSEKDISSILITGGTGSFGKKFIDEILTNHKYVKRLVILSRDELKQWELKQKYPFNKYPQLRFYLGDIRDKSRLIRALEGIDAVIHAAALKQVPTAEYNPMEFIKTNILGAENLVNACFQNNVKKIIALSTDKAAAPINLYGATKLCSDKLFVAANNVRGSKKSTFSVVRYGNVMGSRGSVIPFFIEKAKNGIIPITDEQMTRFNITLEEGVKMVIWSLFNTLGGEILIPKIPSYKILDVANAIGPSCKKIIIGSRPGEKIHEEMITPSDSLHTLDIGDYFSILPPDTDLKEKVIKAFPDSNFVQKGFSYNSKNNSTFLTIENIRSLIVKYVDKSFLPI